jgi:transcriptional regulator with XRE-family HTH domain
VVLKDELGPHLGMDIFTVFGLNLRRLRIPRRLTQEAAGDLMQLERAHFSRAERGRQNVTLKTIDKVSRILGCQWSDLFDEKAALDFAASLTTKAPRVAKAKTVSRKRKRARRT